MSSNARCGVLNERSDWWLNGKSMHAALANAVLILASSLLVAVAALVFMKGDPIMPQHSAWT